VPKPDRFWAPTWMMYLRPDRTPVTVQLVAAVVQAVATLAKWPFTEYPVMALVPELAGADQEIWI